MAKSNFNLKGDAEWERDCYMDIMGVCVCTRKGGREKGEKLKGGKRKKSLNESLVMGRQG